MASPHVVVVTSKNLETTLAQSSGAVLLDFWAQWCGPCRMIGPVVDELATEYAGKAVIGKVDIDSEQDLAVKYGVMSIPTLLFFKNGNVVRQIVGVKSKSEIKAALDSAIAG